MFVDFKLSFFFVITRLSHINIAPKNPKYQKAHAKSLSIQSNTCGTCEM